MKLINKGKFRERANRSEKYSLSENQIAQLDHHNYKHHRTVQKESTVLQDNHDDHLTTKNSNQN